MMDDLDDPTSSDDNEDEEDDENSASSNEPTEQIEQVYYAQKIGILIIVVWYFNSVIMLWTIQWLKKIKY